MISKTIILAVFINQYYDTYQYNEVDFPTNPFIWPMSIMILFLEML
ncbi:MAG: hypothetical protein JXA79_12695 [Deltaproteobacteria bacterium]|nr:hypothetical protein [Deltaproteobacteria bacterium]